MKLLHTDPISYTYPTFAPTQINLIQYRVLSDVRMKILASDGRMKILDARLRTEVFTDESVVILMLFLTSVSEGLGNVAIFIRRVACTRPGPRNLRRLRSPSSGTSAIQTAKLYDTSSSGRWSAPRTGFTSVTKLDWSWGKPVCGFDIDPGLYSCISHQRTDASSAEDLKRAERQADGSASSFVSAIPPRVNSQSETISSPAAIMLCTDLENDKSVLVRGMVGYV